MGAAPDDTGEVVSNSDVFVSIVYTLYVVAPAIRDELWLRTALFFNSFGFALWGFWIGSWPVVVANAMFCVISLRQMIRAYEERRPVELPEDAAVYGTTFFPDMSRSDLKRFWQLGETLTLNHRELATLGEPSSHLYVVLEGATSVTRSDGSTIERPAPIVVGEISTLSADDRDASATVVTRNARVQAWDKADLSALQESHPSFTGPFLKGLARQMAGRVAV